MILSQLRNMVTNVDRKIIRKEVERKRQKKTFR